MKHIAKQFPLPIDPPVKLSLTITLTGDEARLWNNYLAYHSALHPSNGQLAVAMISLGLQEWEANRQSEAKRQSQT